MLDMVPFTSFRVTAGGLSKVWVAAADAVTHLVLMTDEHPRVRAGRATLYRLYDVGYDIDLARAAELVGSDVVGPRRPRRGEAAALVTPRPPLTLGLAAEPAIVASPVFAVAAAPFRLDSIVPGTKLSASASPRGPPILV